MTSPLVRAAVALVRVWGGLYTRGLPPHLRKRRRDEIASDVWQQVSEGEEYPVYLACQLFWRLVVGLADDIAWRFEKRQAGWFWRHTIVGVALLALAVIVTRSTATHLPSPPPPPAFSAHIPPSSPPPPPPPPLDRRGGSVPLDFTYGETSYTVTPQATAPRRLKEVRPVYPPLLKDAAVEGVVVVSGRITQDGRVADAHVVQPAGLLGQSAIDAVRQWEFAPSQSTGARSERLLTVSVTFSSAK
jgi:TonB family protein